MRLCESPTSGRRQLGSRQFFALLSFATLSVPAGSIQARDVVDSPVRPDARLVELEQRYARVTLWQPRLTIVTGAAVLAASASALVFASMVQSGDCSGPCEARPIGAMALAGAGVGTGALMLGLGIPWLVHRRHARRDITRELLLLRAPVISAEHAGAVLHWSMRF